MPCNCCGSNRTNESPILWQELISAWRLAAHEVHYINRQQGFHCQECVANMRTMALARAIMMSYGFDGLFCDFMRTDTAQSLRILEINKAASLTQFLEIGQGHLLACYPDVNIMDLSYEDESFDLVVHSDTLEHIPRPVRALSECLRVLRRAASVRSPSRSSSSD